MSVVRPHLQLSDPFWLATGEGPSSLKSCDWGDRLETKQGNGIKESYLRSEAGGRVGLQEVTVGKRGHI